MLDDFRTESRTFIATMMRPESDAAIREWILDDMSAAPADVALKDYFFRMMRPPALTPPVPFSFT